MRILSIIVFCIISWMTAAVAQEATSEATENKSTENKSTENKATESKTPVDALPDVKSATTRMLESVGALRNRESNSEKKALSRLRNWLGSPNTNTNRGITEAETEKLADPDAVRGEREDLKAWLTNRDNQRKLIASGALNGEVGSVSLDKLRSAIAAFRAANGSSSVGMITDAEQADLDASEKEIDTFARFEERMNTKAKIPVYLPLGLVSDQFENPENLDEAWTTYASGPEKGNIRVDQLNYKLRSETPISLATMLLERRKDLQFDALDLAGDNFKIEASALNKARDGREYIAFSAREIKGRIQGYGLRVALEPPQGFAVPIVRVVHAPTPTDAAAVIAGSAATPQENWRALIRILHNLIASRHNETDSYAPISRRSCAGVETSEKGTVKTVRILYATDRMPTFKAGLTAPYDLSALFGSQLDSSRLHLGCLEVQVRTKGTSEAVGAYGSGIKRLFETRIQDRPVTAIKFTPFEPPIDFTQTKRLVFRSDEVSGAERALLYIHGYNNGFEDAVSHVANIAASTEYDGQIYLFSWPSTQRFFNYAPDMDLAEQSEVHLSAFLRAIASSGDLIGLDIVAHSMGSQILLRALDGLRPMLDRRILKGSGYDRFRLGQIIFAAPDVSSIVFAQKVQPFKYFADRITVYASGNDGVLAFSSLLRGNVPRAGYIQGGVPMSADGVHVIDITRAPEDRYMLGKMCGNYHAAFVTDASVLEDIVYILRQGQSGRSAVRRATPDRRSALAGITGKFQENPYPTATPEQAGRYWALNPLYGLPKQEKKFMDPSIARFKEDVCANL